jgi:hypothetical protein
MTWAAPWMLAGGILASAMMVLLHVIAWDRPEPAALPTARFVPEPRAVPAARRQQLSDWLLLLLRVIIVMLIAAAFARPTLVPERTGASRVVLVDLSRAVVDSQAVLDSARSWLSEGDQLIRFGREESTGRGSISGALINGMRAAWASGSIADSSELVLVSPVLREELDAATTAIRDAWPGEVRIVRVAGLPPAGTTYNVEVVPGENVAAAAALSGVGLARPARLTTTPATAGDSSFARAGGVLLEWLRPAGRADSALAMVTRSGTAVGRFSRDSLAGSGLVVARWSDGRAAAAETPLGDGCLRTVRTGVAEGDMVLRAAFLHAMRDLLSPCSTIADPAPAADSIVRQLQQRSSGEDSGQPAAAGIPLAPWLLAGALALALLELRVRIRS